MSQPGEQWLYNTSAQVLGVVLARAGGRDLESVLRERVFEPLGMADTGLHRPRREAEPAHHRVPRPIPRPATLAVLDDPAGQLVEHAALVPDASGWLVSTIDDYWSFVSMLLRGRHRARRARALAGDGRAHDGRPAARRPSAMPRRSSSASTASWGLGLAVPADRIGRRRRFPCGIGWDGGTGTTWRSNPRTGVTGILFTQRAATSPVPSALVNDFWAGVNAAAAA